MSEPTKAENQQILAANDNLTDRRRHRIEQVINQRQRDLMVIMEDVHNPHNLAAIARSCDAFGVQTLGFTLENSELFDPSDTGKATSTSASKWLDYRVFEQGTEHALTTLKAEGWHILVTVIDDDAPTLYEADLLQYDKLALLVGNEHAGISPTARRLADSTLTIPMMGMIQSFNVSVATALILYEINRQRRASGDDYGLSETSRAELFSEFVRRTREKPVNPKKRLKQQQNKRRR